MCRSELLQGLRAVHGTPVHPPMLSSLAKAKPNELVKRVNNKPVEMHDGIGMTDALKLGVFFTYAQVATQIFGDPGYHEERYPAVCGYERYRLPK